MAIDLLAMTACTTDCPTNQIKIFNLRYSILNLFGGRTRYYFNLL